MEDAVLKRPGGITPEELAEFKTKVRRGDLLYREADSDPFAASDYPRKNRVVLARVADAGKPWIVIFEGGRSLPWAQALILNRNSRRKNREERRWR